MVCTALWTVCEDTPVALCTAWGVSCEDSSVGAHYGLLTCENVTHSLWAQKSSAPKIHPHRPRVIHRLARTTPVIRRVTYAHFGTAGARS